MAGSRQLSFVLLAHVAVELGVLSGAGRARFLRSAEAKGAYGAGMGLKTAYKVEQSSESGIKRL